MNRQGNGRHGAKACVEQSRQLDVRQLQRSGRLLNGLEYGWSWSQNGTKLATIQLTVRSDEVQMHYSRCLRNGQWASSSCAVSLERTPCHLGGERVWWRCPEHSCGRRVAVLYGGARIACRHCHDLAYRCQRESAEDRAARQANKIRRKLGWMVGVLNFPGGKPKGMHWKTFSRLQAIHDEHAHAAMAAMARSLGLMRDKLEHMR
ncbi:MAG: hypothetical protein MUF44_00670 [Hydrogenophaga sp.]|jgi:hypothetical protein|nr:hypothetical protein [Hydrogenophaga sp.]